MHSRSGQVALVVGGTGALGKAIAVRLASEGADIAFTYHSSEGVAAELAATIEEMGRTPEFGQVDISTEDQVVAFMSRLIDRFGRLDTLVYASGPKFDLQFTAEVGSADWMRVFTADVHGCFHAVSSALPHLRKSCGSVVAVTAAAVERALARDVLSLAPKSAITSLIRHIAVEEGRYGVRANCVAPGYIDGGIGRDIMDAVGEELVEKLVKAVPLRRMGAPEEVADAVAYLTSLRSAYVTGTTVFVSGGLEL